MLSVRFFQHSLVFLLLSDIAVAADLLPLSHGIFVESSVACTSASNATALSYWGDELNSSKVIGTIVKVKKSGESYQVTLDLNIQGESGGKEDWTIVIKDPRHMRVTSAYGTSSYRWCFSQMP